MYWMYSMCMTPTYTPVAAGAGPVAPAAVPARAPAVVSNKMRDCGSIRAASLPDSLHRQRG